MILALKTADAVTHMWLLGPDGQTVAQLEWESGRDLSSQLLERLTGLLGDNHLKLQDLTGLAVFSGPGSFTSLRIGHTVMNALADSLAVPVVGVRGEDWLTQVPAALAAARPGLPALPFYGGEAHITRPKR